MKGAVLYALQDHPLLQPRGEMDSSVYVALARYPTEQPFPVSPLYLYFLRALDVNLFVVRVVQILLGAMAVLLIFDCARLWFGDRAATIAALLAILTGIISFYEVTLLQAALDPFLVALTLSLLAHALFQKDPILFFAAGLTAGLFVLNRPNAIVWIPVLAIGLMWTRGWRVAVVLLIAFAMPIAAVTVRNFVVSGQFVMIASHGGLNFYIGNNPASELLLFARRIAYTFNQTDLALNYSYSYFTKDAASPLRFLVIGPWLLFPLGIAGALRHLRNPRFAVWASFIPAYAISVAIFFVSSRDRLPLLIPMCITAGAMFVQPRVWTWIVAVIIGVGVCWNFGLDDGRAHERTNMIVYLLEGHRLDEAAKLIEDTERITRDPATLHARAAASYKQAGIELVRANQSGQAMAAFEAAHHYDPADASNLLNIAVLQAKRGDTIAARENARAALRLRPDYPQAIGLLRALEGR